MEKADCGERKRRYCSIEGKKREERSFPRQKGGEGFSSPLWNLLRDQKGKRMVRLLSIVEREKRGEKKEREEVLIIRLALGGEENSPRTDL